MIVVDVGCARYGGDYSIERLIEEFSPDVVYGFDPHPATDEIVARTTGPGLTLPGTRIVVERKAAWTHEGEIGFVEAGLGSHVGEGGDVQVPCFDLAGFICDIDSRHLHPSESPGIVLKIDAEGAEYELLEHLIATGHDRWVKLAWVEWHPPGRKVNSRPDERREAIEARIGCELAQWNW